MTFPLAYHITFGTYGTRLHGDERGTVDRRQNTPGEPIIGRDDDWQQLEASQLNFPPVQLSDEQRLYVEQIIPAICARGGWAYHTCAARRDHLHVELSASAEGKAARKWLKRWLGEALSKRWPLPQGARWFAVGGSVHSIWNRKYFERVFGYIEAQRTTPRCRGAATPL